MHIYILYNPCLKIFLGFLYFQINLQFNLSDLSLYNLSLSDLSLSLYNLCLNLCLHELKHKILVLTHMTAKICIIILVPQMGKDHTFPNPMILI